ncbi:MAG: M50 family metallopeptidase, partial [Candidatus Obscuribacterales bacterium]|nr:M50 family metallopeptidase [Candidatus Obscuribacterales bacterium]
MDFTLSLSSDWFNLMSIPLILLTLKEVLPNWKSIWDNELSMSDRRMIMRIVIFLALPVVVFIHELGHLLAALALHVKVYEFHYGPVTGHVNVAANIPAESQLWIAVAGNLAQIVLGLACLALSTLARSPALICFLVYLGLFAVGDTVIFYTLLSLASIYGDWVQIYSNPCHSLVFAVGSVHVLLVALVIYCIYGTAPKLWYTKKTMPAWSSRHKKL